MKEPPLHHECLRIDNKSYYFVGVDAEEARPYLDYAYKVCTTFAKLEAVTEGFKLVKSLPNPNMSVLHKGSTVLLYFQPEWTFIHSLVSTGQAMGIPE